MTIRALPDINHEAEKCRSSSSSVYKSRLPRTSQQSIESPDIEQLSLPNQEDTPDLTRFQAPVSECSSPFLLPNAPSFFQESLVVSIIILAQLLARAGLSQAIAPITYIGSTFNTTSPSDTLWFPSAFSLTAGTFILVAGRIGDIIGHKVLFLYGLAWYAFWSLLAGISAVPRNPSVVFFDVCRAMQGVAAAVLTPTGLVILGSMYKPGPRKAKAFSIFGAAAPNGVVLGALFSSLLAQRTWWPWAYWVLAIMCVVLAAVSWWALPDFQNMKQRKTRSNREEGEAQTNERSGIGEKSFDWWGSLTGVAGLTLFNVAWNQAPSEGWQTPYIIVLLILGVTFIAAFIYVETSITAFDCDRVDVFRGTICCQLCCSRLGELRSVGVLFVGIPPATQRSDAPECNCAVRSRNSIRTRSCHDDRVLA
jgi:MFS family permease